MTKLTLKDLQVLPENDIRAGLQSKPEKVIVKEAKEIGIEISQDILNSKKVEIFNGKEVERKNRIIGYILRCLQPSGAPVARKAKEILNLIEKSELDLKKILREHKVVSPVKLQTYEVDRVVDGNHVHQKRTIPIWNWEIIEYLAERNDKGNISKIVRNRYKANDRTLASKIESYEKVQFVEFLNSTFPFIMGNYFKNKEVPKDWQVTTTLSKTAEEIVNFVMPFYTRTGAKSGYQCRIYVKTNKKSLDGLSILQDSMNVIHIDNTQTADNVDVEIDTSIENRQRIKV